MSGSLQQIKIHFAKPVMETVDPRQLIVAVRDRRVLWDKIKGGYKGREQSANAWKEVCQQLNPHFSNMSDEDQNYFVQITMRKWKNLRDTWLKDKKKRLVEIQQHGQPKSKREFVYSQQMRFLEDVCRVGSSGQPSFSVDHDYHQSCSEDVDFEDSSSLDGTSNDSAIRMPVPKKRSRLHDMDDAVIPEPQDTRQDRHLSFFKGIIPSLSMLDEDQVIEFQAGVINLLQNVRKRKSSESMTQTTPLDIDTS